MQLVGPTRQQLPAGPGPRRLCQPHSTLRSPSHLLSRLAWHQPYKCQTAELWAHSGPPHSFQAGPSAGGPVWWPSFSRSPGWLCTLMATPPRKDWTRDQPAPVWFVYGDTGSIVTPVCLQQRFPSGVTVSGDTGAVWGQLWLSQPWSGMMLHPSQCPEHPKSDWGLHGVGVEMPRESVSVLAPRRQDQVGWLGDQKAHSPLDRLTWLLPQPPGITREETLSAPAPLLPAVLGRDLAVKGSLVPRPFHLLLAAFQYLSSFAAYGEALTPLGPRRGYLCFPQGWPVTSVY